MPSTVPDRMTKLPPFFLVKAIQAVRRVLQILRDRMFPASVVFYEKFQNFFLIPPLYVAAELDIAEHLRSGPKNLEELAHLTNTDAPSLYRVLRVLASEGIFREKPEKIFRMTAMAKPLLSGRGSLRDVLRQHLSRENWQSLGDLIHTVKTGQNAFEHIHGMPIYDYLDKHPGHYQIFDRSMAGLSDLGLAPLLRRYPFSRYRTIADIGGGEGSLLSGIMTAYPEINGILFDLESALIKAADHFHQLGLENRVQIVPGNFFTGIPVEADAFLMKNILHNWGDEQCVGLLKNLSASMNPVSKLLIIEMILPENNTPSTAKLIDIQMMATMPGGKERTLNEFIALLEKAGLKFIRTVHTLAPVSIIEAGR